MEGLGDLTVWLEADDADGRAVRAKRLRDLLDILQVPSEEFSFLGGDLSVICFNEVRRCYLDGSNMAVVFLCLAFVERELAAWLYAAGWGEAKKARLEAVLGKAYEAGGLSEPDWRAYRHLAELRNSYAHFRAPGTQSSLMVRTIEEDALGREVLAKDARRALQTMARFFKRPSGTRVTPAPPRE